MAENVLADARFTIQSVLRPFPGFEAVYQGQSFDIPIAACDVEFFESHNFLADDLARLNRAQRRQALNERS